MCGILGLAQRTKNIDKDIFVSMLDTIEKRGPDQSGYFLEDNIALGHRRLSIIDLSENGRQPMQNVDENIILIFNGEIYNYQDIKSKIIDNYKWNSKTDSEVILHGYEQYGNNIVKQLSGMFAFAIYDKTKQKILLARDHFGKKPLYYYADEEFFCFGSELKSIIKNIEIKKKLKIDQDSLLKYLFYGYVPSPNSIFDKIKKVHPSHILEFDLNSWKICSYEEYWDLSSIQVRNDYDEQYILEKTEELVKSAIDKRLMSDVPLGLFLSGGVDSGLIASYMSKITPNLNAYTVDYEEFGDISEAKYAKQISSNLNINHHICNFNDNMVEECFTNILNYLDEPMADSAIVPLYFIAKFASQDIKVVLSGDGGDEVFGGYHKYVAQKFISDYSYLKFLTNIGKKFISSTSPYYKLLDGFSLPFSARQFIFGSGSFLGDEVIKLLNLNNLDINKVFEESNNYLEKFKQIDIINQSLYLDCKIQLPDWYFVKGDRATMANSIEMRNPLVDKDLVEFAFSLGGNWKVRNGETKYILKKLASKYIDKNIVYRKKSGFWSPLNKRINNELNNLFEKYLFIDNGFFNQDYVNKLYQEHKSLKADNSFKLLRIFNFNYWYKKYYE